ncbi:hypothetical protein ACMYYO_12260 [Dermacoccaceae bacterium W4C1]
MTCSVLLIRAAYVGGLGWAPPGQEWLVAVNAWASSTQSFVTHRRGEGKDVTYARYDRAADPQAQMQVTAGASATAVPVARSAGAGSVDRRSIQLPDRAYLVPQEELVTVTMKVSQRLTLNTRSADTQETQGLPTAAVATSSQVWRV